MKLLRYAINVLLISLFLVACTYNEALVNEVKTANPTVVEMLTPESDIILWNDSVYMTDIAWLNDLILTEDDFLGTITSVSDDADEFVNGTANKLSVGAELYSANERGAVLIVKENDTIKYYLQLLEG